MTVHGEKGLASVGLHAGITMDAAAAHLCHFLDLLLYTHLLLLYYSSDWQVLQQLLTRHLASSRPLAPTQLWAPMCIAVPVPNWLVPLLRDLPWFDAASFLLCLSKRQRVHE
jgi:hypothetical protein